MPDDSVKISLKKAADRAGLSKWEFVKEVKKKDIPVIKNGQGVYFEPDELRKYFLLLDEDLVHLQTDGALQFLAGYRARIRAADPSVGLPEANEVNKLNGKIEGLEDVIKGFEEFELSDTQRKVHQYIKSTQVELTAERDEYLLKYEQGELYPVEKNVEVFINRHQGIVDVILPLQQEDLEPVPLAKKLYDAVEESCGESGDFTEFLFIGGYLGFRMQEESVDVKKLCQAIMKDNVPAEYGGNCRDAILFLHVAKTSFGYEGE